ncbi:MAG: hypothetical protein KatS3mg038_2996 [Candidatus Kapaibacterium sp.]|jgi:phage host-nuclease inhibitor protein Gam|nr:MAG: hypothetical protein KatS3mg038_2996 [Candidatus Kapabacteria bacterium]
MRKSTKVTALDPAEHLYEYAQLDAEKRKIEAKMDAEIAQIREKYADRLLKLDRRLEELFDGMLIWAEANQHLFEGKRSLDYPHGVVGYRLGNPAVRLQRGMTTDKVIALAREIAPDLVAIKESLNKDLIIDRRDDLAREGILDRLKIQIVQEDRFYVQPKTEETT